MSIPTFGDLRKKFFDGMWHAIGRIIRGGLIGFLLAAISIEVAAYFLSSDSGASVWPEARKYSAPRNASCAWRCCSPKAASQRRQCRRSTNAWHLLPTHAA
jgi:hypothetical protein